MKDLRETGPIIKISILFVDLIMVVNKQAAMINILFR